MTLYIQKTRGNDYMKNILNRYRKQCIITGFILLVVMLALYFRALFLPGLWHGDAFLYKQDDGSFIGSDIYANYEMNINPADYGKNIQFRVNEKTKDYQIKYDESDLDKKVEILENGNTIFSGKSFRTGDSWMLLDDEYNSPDEIIFHVGNYIPTEEDLFPGYTRLYNWSVSNNNDTRGNPGVLILILIFAVILFLDIKFPTLFWLLEHRLDVDGGEPSDWYYFGQKVGRFSLLIGILVCVVLTFTIH